MTSYLASALLATGLMASPPGQVPDAALATPTAVVTAARGACDRAVQQALAMTGGELMSVQTARGGKPICRVTVLVVKPNGRPVKVKLKIPMDF
jgi:hypothetical protein